MKLHTVQQCAAIAHYHRFASHFEEEQRSVLVKYIPQSRMCARCRIFKGAHQSSLLEFMNYPCLDSVGDTGEDLFAKTSLMRNVEREVLLKETSELNGMLKEREAMEANIRVRFENPPVIVEKYEALGVLKERDELDQYCKDLQSNHEKKKKLGIW